MLRSVKEASDKERPRRSSGNCWKRAERRSGRRKEAGERALAGKQEGRQVLRSLTSSLPSATSAYSVSTLRGKRRARSASSAPSQPSVWLRKRTMAGSQAEKPLCCCCCPSASDIVAVDSRGRRIRFTSPLVFCAALLTIVAADTCDVSLLPLIGAALVTLWFSTWREGGEERAVSTAVPPVAAEEGAGPAGGRSEERRVGKEAEEEEGPAEGGGGSRGGGRGG